MLLKGDAALFDIEGTVSSIAFVRDVLFPFAAKRMDDFVAVHENDTAVRDVLEAAAREAGVDVSHRDAVLRALHEWSDRDVKITPLKTLQGLIWQHGFESGELSSDPYRDAVDALHRFHDNAIALHVYSSGSIAAQRLFFGHTRRGSLLDLFGHHFDTTIGAKNEPGSYGAIAEAIGAKPGRIVFFSDAGAELDAASAAGFQTVGLARPQDAGAPIVGHPVVASFDGIEMER